MKVILILIFFFSVGYLAAQQTCYECKGKIKSEYLYVDGKYFHAEHFLCTQCRKPIDGEYTKSEGKYYHSKCYFNEVLPKCDVCSKPLDGEFLTDIYDYKYHKYHLSENNYCDNCGRLAADKITNGGRQFNDSRYLCNLCNRNAIKSDKHYNDLLAGVKNRLNNMGLRINSNSIEVFPVDQNELNSIAKKSGKDRLRGFCLIETKQETRGNKSTTSNKYSIYVLDNIPSIYTEATIAHELMHVWLHQNTNMNHDEQLEEGSCHFISYTYLKTQRLEEASWISKLMKNDSNQIYGGGFRKVLSRFQNKPLSELLNFLKKNKQLR